MLLGDVRNSFVRSARRAGSLFSERVKGVSLIHASTVCSAQLNLSVHNHICEARYNEIDRHIDASKQQTIEKK